MIATIWRRWLRKLSLKQRIQRKHHACAMSAIVCNGTTLLNDELSCFDEESKWLASTGKENPDGYGAVYYHDNYYRDHNYQSLETPSHQPASELNSDTHFFKQQSNIHSHSTFNNFCKIIKDNQGKVFVGHTHRNSKGEPAGVFAPFIYYDKKLDITYSFAFHGSIDKLQLFSLPDFIDWIGNYNREYLNTTLHSGSEYLFLWLIKNIHVHDGNVLSGLYQGLQSVKHIPSQINMFFSDGTGVYAFTNQIDTESAVKHVMAYKISRTVNNICSYQVRSWKQNPGLGWISFKEHSLYYFPTQGAMQIYVNIDSAKYADVQFRPMYNWACFSILAYNQSM